MSDRGDAGSHAANWLIAQSIHAARADALSTEPEEGRA